MYKMHIHIRTYIHTYTPIYCMKRTPHTYTPDKAHTQWCPKNGFCQSSYGIFRCCVVVAWSLASGNCEKRVC